MKKYPTKRQILAEPRPKFKRGLMALVSAWKAISYKGWNALDDREKFWGLQSLATAINLFHDKENTLIIDGEINRYKPAFGRAPAVIFLTRPPSLISFFHELAHHLFGPDELTACRWSVWLYKLRFRKDYENLVWDGHLLRRSSSGTRRSSSKNRES